MISLEQISQLPMATIALLACMTDNLVAQAVFIVLGLFGLGIQLYFSFA